MSGPDVVVRAARPDDVEAIWRFGGQVIPGHYAPLIGERAAQEQADTWWSSERRRLIDALVAQLPPDADQVDVEHFAANERAGAFYEREGFAIERIEPSASGDPRRAVVWRSRRLR